MQACRPGCPDFGSSVNPISTRGDRLCPPNYYWHTQIFRPSDGPAKDLSYQFLYSVTMLIWHVIKCTYVQMLSLVF